MASANIKNEIHLSLMNLIIMGYFRSFDKLGWKKDEGASRGRNVINY